MDFRSAEDFRLHHSVLCMIADHGLVFGRCHNKEPHSSGILLCRVVVVGYEKAVNSHSPLIIFPTLRIASLLRK